MTRTPVQSRVYVNSVEMAVWEWSGDRPPIFFCHATGFHARIWDRVIGRLPANRCIAFDARGHGRSSKPAPPYNWRDLGADVAALAETLGLAGAIGVGHSMGGHAVTLGSALQPRAFSALALFDPVIRPKDRYCGPWEKSAFVAKRRNQWASAQEMFERFENRPPFDTWDRQTLRDYCDHALEAQGDHYVLACPPAIEASIYANSTATESNIYAEISTIMMPVHVVRSGRARDALIMNESPTAPDLAASFLRGADTCLADYSHFFPMESPELAAKLIADAVTLL